MSEILQLTVPWGLNVTNAAPADQRLVYDTMDQVWGEGAHVGYPFRLTPLSIYQGLKIFIRDEQQEYMFRAPGPYAPLSTQGKPKLVKNIDPALTELIETVSKIEAGETVTKEFTETIIEKIFTETQIKTEFLETIITEIFATETITNQLIEKLFETEHLETLIEKIFESNTVTETLVEKLFTDETITTLVEKMFESNTVTEKLIESMFASADFKESMKGWWAKEELRAVTQAYYDANKNSIPDETILLIKADA
jgi:hypothetical protein